MPVFGLSDSQVKKAKLRITKGKLFFLSMPLVPNAGFSPFIYSNDTIAKVVKVEKELTMREAFAL